MGRLDAETDSALYEGKGRGPMPRRSRRTPAERAAARAARVRRSEAQAARLEQRAAAAARRAEIMSQAGVETLPAADEVRAASQVLEGGVRSGAMSRQSLRGQLGEHGITLAYLAAGLRAAIETGGPREALRAIETAIGLYDLSAEEVAAWRTSLGADTEGGGDTHQHVHFHSASYSPAALALLEAIARDPEVAELVERKAAVASAGQASEVGGG